MHAHIDLPKVLNEASYVCYTSTVRHARKFNGSKFLKQSVYLAGHRFMLPWINSRTFMLLATQPIGQERL